MQLASTGTITEAAARGAESPQGDAQSPMPTKIHRRAAARPRERGEMKLERHETMKAAVSVF